MPATENSRRNQAQPTLENPSLPDHDRNRDEGMHAAIPRDMLDVEETNVGNIPEGDEATTGSMHESATAAPDQAFAQIIQSGTAGNNGRIPEDPNNWLTSEPEHGYADGDPENRGESTVDEMDGDQH